MKLGVSLKIFILSVFVMLLASCDFGSGSSIELGDIVLSNNTIISVDEISEFTINEYAQPMGVIVDVSSDGEKATMLGLECSSRPMSWAPRDTTGFDTMFEGIKVTRQGSVESGYTFSGDSNGRDNWKVVCDVDKEGVLDAKTNYPAYNFVNTYGSYASNLTSKYVDDWYLPSIMQLYDLYLNRATVQKSLKAVGGFDLESKWYWSSSQAFSNNNGVYGVVFSNGEVTNVYKYCSGGSVLVFHDIKIRDFF